MEIRNGADKTDPLLVASLDNGRALYDAISKYVNGLPIDAVINAGANLIVNALRQEHAKRDTAGKAFDEVFGRMKQTLMNHYDTLGRKRGIFPYDQVIVAETVSIDKDSIKW